MGQHTKTEGKKTYEAPRIEVYSADKVLAGLGPALAIYGDLP